MCRGEEGQRLTPMELRERVGLTQRQIAQILDIRQGTVSDWERRRSVPHLPPSKFKRLLDAYGCTLEDLIEAFEGGEPTDN